MPLNPPDNRIWISNPAFIRTLASGPWVQIFPVYVNLRRSSSVR